MNGAYGEGLAAFARLHDLVLIWGAAAVVVLGCGAAIWFARKHDR